MSQTTSNPPTATFNEFYYQVYVHGIQEDFGTIGLLVGLYGILITLSLLSVYLLVARCTRKTRPTTVILSLTIFTILASTTIHTVTWIFARQSDFLKSLIESGAILWSKNDIYQSLTGTDPPPVRVKNYTRVQYCAGTAALTINITLGDAIVCWRACVVWHGNRAVKVACSIFLLATLALGAVDTAFSCNSNTALVSEAAETVVLMVGFLYEGFPAGIAASVLSLSTNLLATLLVRYKAWESRSSLRGYLVAGPRATQVTKLFTLLIESGAIYSTFWVIVVGFQVGQYRLLKTANPNYQEGFFDVVGVIMNGSLVPLIAFYPCIIAIIVALNRSRIERGFLGHAQSVTPPTLPVTFETSMTNRHGIRSSQRVIEMVAMNEAHFQCGDGLGDARRPRSSGERKVEEIA